MPPRGYCANLPAGTKARAKYRCRRSASDCERSAALNRSMTALGESGLSQL